MKVADVVTVHDILCDNLYAAGLSQSNYFNIEPEFTDSNGLTGLLMCAVAKIMGSKIYNIDMLSLTKKALSFNLHGSTYIRNATLDLSRRLVNLTPQERQLSGLVDVSFHGVDVTEIGSFDFPVYCIAYTFITIDLVSDMYYFHEHVDIA
jgi:hypothetical protein